MTNKREAKFAALAAIDGLTLSDCFFFFLENTTAREQAIAARAQDKDFDTSDTIVAESEDGDGARVFGSRWVEFDEDFKKVLARL
jgi:hypothetical protein